MVHRLSRRHVLAGAAALVAAPRALAQTIAPPSPATSAPARRLIDAATAQIGVTTIYDAAYVRIPFPGGDVPQERGVCTDVVVRAYRRAFGFDLQAAVNDDMRRAFAAYPQRWGLSAADANIDHRRVPNLATFFRRRGAERPMPADLSGFEPGDVVAQVLPNGRPHIVIVSDEPAAAGGHRLAIHNIGMGTRSDDVLGQYRVTGRFTFFPA